MQPRATLCHLQEQRKKCLLCGDHDSSGCETDCAIYGLPCIDLGVEALYGCLRHHSWSGTPQVSDEPSSPVRAVLFPVGLAYFRGAEHNNKFKGSHNFQPCIQSVKYQGVHSSSAQQARVGLGFGVLGYPALRAVSILTCSPLAMLFTAVFLRSHDGCPLCNRRFRHGAPACRHCFMIPKGCVYVCLSLYSSHSLFACSLLGLKRIIS